MKFSQLLSSLLTSMSASSKIVGGVAKVPAGNGWGTVHAQWNRATACGKQQTPGWFQNKLVCSNAVCRFCRPEEAALRRIEMQIARIGK